MADGDRLPDLTQVPSEDRDRLWYETYYLPRKDTPQLTVRAVMMGGVLGMFMAMSNLYTTLKLGWAFGVAITACVLSYVIWQVFLKLRIAKTPMSILENNCMQSTASAAGYSTGGTIATAVGALLLITGDAGRMSWVTVAVWVFLVALLGVFLAIPMKRQMINTEQLPFPSGIAAAETLKSLYAAGEESVRKARALVTGLFAGAATYVLRGLLGVIPEAINLPGVLTTVAGRPVTAGAAGVAFEPSLLLIAAGMIVGLRVSISMLIGAIINWFVLTPYILSLPAWSQANKIFVGQMEVALGDGGSIDVVKVTRWSLWLGTALMVASGLTSFALSWRTIARAFTTFGKTAGGNDAAMAEIEVPTRWLVIGGIPITLGLMALCWLSFGINPLLGLLSVVLSFVLSLVACRATGETDTTPVGAMGKITQFIYAVLAPADKTINLMTAGITAGAASSSADLLTDLKSGYLLGANARQQFQAQFYGVFFGTVAIVPCWYLMVPNKAALEAFNPPATNMWFAVAEALSTGISAIPESARYAIVIGGLIGVALPVLESLFPKARKFMPSAMGLGLAFVVTFANSFSFFIGALVAYVWTRINKANGERYIVPLASGAVAGESLLAAGDAMTHTIIGLLGVGGK